jgi:ribonuclease P protein component
LRIKNLKNKKLIETLFKSNLFVVQNEIKVSRDNGEENPPFFCVSVPKKHFSRAVDRNKIRRRIKAALCNINIRLSGNYLVVYKSFSIMTYKEIEKTLTHIFILYN